MRNKKQKNKKPFALRPLLFAREGFTLVELLVSMTVFVIVVSIATGIFVRALRTQRSMVALIAANDNTSLMLEQMAREIRTGKDFSVNTSQELDFTNAKGETVSYFLENETVKKNDGSQTVALTAGNVAVKDLEFSLLTSDSDGADYRPRVTISLSISAKTGDFAATPTVIQTTVSARALNN